MGCIFSQAAPAQRNRRVIPRITFDDESDGEPPPPQELSITDIFKRDTYNILHGLQQINALDDLTPVVPLSSQSFPLLLQDFVLDSEDPDGIQLPIAAISRVGPGRYFLMGSISILTHAMIIRTETSAFIENTIIWGSDFRMKTIRILLLGFPSQLMSTLSTDLVSFGYIVDTSYAFPKQITYDIIFIPSNLDLPGIEESLAYFTSIGGAVFVFAADKSCEGNRFHLNPFLTSVGLAYAQCSLNPQYSSVSIIDFEELCDNTFGSISNQYLNLLAQDNEVQLEDLDRVVGKLRYYVGAMGPSGYEDAMNLVQQSWDFLRRMNYITEDGICPLEIHGVVTVILSELTPKLPLSEIKVAEGAEDFPGLIGKCRLSTRSMRLVIHRGMWVSTGLYMPAGQICHIESSAPVTIQIGSHTEVLLLKPGPWKRWPIMSTRYYYEDQPMDIASPFGGIMYLISEEPRNLNLTCSGFSRYPRYNAHKPSYWDATKDIEAPWAEIEMFNLTLTMPSVEARKIEDIGEFVKNMDLFTSTIHNFVGARATQHHRIIFDVDLPNNEPICGECIVVHMDTLHGLLLQNEPTPDLLKLLTLIGVSSITPNLFDEEAEIAIATVSAAFSMKKVWEDLNLVDCITGTAPKVFFDLWDVCERFGSKPFQEAIRSYSIAKDSASDLSPSEQWTIFVEELGKRTSSNLYQLSDRFKQTGKLDTTLSERLNGYQLEEADM